MGGSRGRHGHARWCDVLRKRPAVLASGSWYLLATDSRRARQRLSTYNRVSLHTTLLVGPRLRVLKTESDGQGHSGRASVTRWFENCLCLCLVCLSVSVSVSFVVSLSPCRFQFKNLSAPEIDR